MDKQFAENLKNARIKAGLTQAQVAEKIGVAPSSYSFYESGKREPDVLKIRQLAPVTPSEPPQAILQLQGLNISEIYETLTKEERRTFWRGIIKEIRFDKDRNFFIDWR